MQSYQIMAFGEKLGCKHDMAGILLKTAFDIFTTFLGDGMIITKRNQPCCKNLIT